MRFTNLEREFKRFCLYERGMQSRSHREIASTVHRLVLHCQGEDLNQIDTAAIKDFLYESRETLGWTNKTFRNKRQYLSTFFQWYYHQGYATSNPVEKVEKPRIPKALPRFLTKEAAKAILSAVRWYSWRSETQRIRNEAILATFLFTGIRLSELLHLRSDHVNLEAQEILIEKGKNSKDRIVPIHPRLSSILTAYTKTKKRSGKWFFTGLTSAKRLYPKNIYAICKTISKATKVKFTPHMLRHTFGRLAVENDFSLYKIKEIMGHADISTTQIYLSVSTENIKESFRKVVLI